MYSTDIYWYRKHCSETDCNVSDLRMLPVFFSMSLSVFPLGLFEPLSSSLLNIIDFPQNFICEDMPLLGIFLVTLFFFLLQIAQIKKCFSKVADF